ncbi:MULTISPECIES: hypothetical protein [Methylosinus]|uniref:3',5'-cyclic-nucleotide phosphodiesterase n=1 Tax=Methylosinus trichosporium (strain ATCC 35070 / NCIMB 11131 / UNIQEM 75 / OB3b) TaxID=595536 RepID=A0A2D2CVL2_METT3|nr:MULTISPECIES: hypothetical protein [Methylosinus]ATQ66832.1 hypothetical protein CQW49_02175 [Methylosinus trichosporium OB3b]OBS54295.1 hypothetical protein A8B73_01535 [Methylosinus sp. 3S-1]
MKAGVVFFSVLLLTTPAVAVDATGIPECDALLKRYEECSAELPRAQVHAAQKELLEGAMSLRANAANPELRPALEKFCVATFEDMKTKSDIKGCMSK